MQSSKLKMACSQLLGNWVSRPPLHNTCPNCITLADVAKDALYLDVVVAAVLFVGLKWLIAHELNSSSFKSCDTR